MKHLRKTTAALFCLGVMAGANGQQNCNANLVATSPDSNFEMQDDGTVIHTASGLMWTVCLAGQNYNTAGETCDGAPLEQSWEQAHLLASTESVGGHTDWRLPNVNELVSILELKCDSPAMNTSIFKGLADVNTLWTSTPTTTDGLGNVVMISSGLPGPNPMTATYPFLLVRKN